MLDSDLNTSNVTVNLKKLWNLKAVPQHLNTSNVTVNQYDQGEFGEFPRFKYI